MHVRLIAFSRRGCALALKISEKLDHDCLVFGKSYFAEGVIPVTSLRGWTEEAFQKADAVVFIGAAGIAVRAAAPFIVSKTKDPALIVLDEKGMFTIPLLSGHIGGANRLALEIADAADSQPVITTATDINGLFSVDTFAEERKMHISSMLLAKDVSAYILEREKMAFCSDFPWEGELPGGLYEADSGDIGVLISSAEGKKPFDKTLQLIPKTIVLGIGCRKGTPEETIEKEVMKTLKNCGISIYSIRAVSSIDLKAEEPGLLEFCSRYGIPSEFYSKDELSLVEGNFEESSFVQSVAGIGNVCERAALKASRGGTLIQKKTAADGVTVAAAADSYKITF